MKHERPKCRQCNERDADQDSNGRCRRRLSAPSVQRASDAPITNHFRDVEPIRAASKPGADGARSASDCQDRPEPDRTTLATGLRWRKRIVDAMRGGMTTREAVAAFALSEEAIDIAVTQYLTQRIVVRD
jgi:hypothetical protein